MYCLRAVTLLLLGAVVLEPVISESEGCSNSLAFLNTTAADLDEIAILQVQVQDLRLHLSGDTPATLNIGDTPGDTPGKLPARTRKGTPWPSKMESMLDSVQDLSDRMDSQASSMLAGESLPDFPSRVVNSQVGTPVQSQISQESLPDFPSRVVNSQVGTPTQNEMSSESISGFRYPDGTPISNIGKRPVGTPTQNEISPEANSGFRYPDGTPISNIGKRPVGTPTQNEISPEANSRLPSNAGNSQSGTPTQSEISQESLPDFPSRVVNRPVGTPTQNEISPEANSRLPSNAGNSQVGTPTQSEISSESISRLPSNAGSSQVGTPTQSEISSESISRLPNSPENSQGNGSPTPTQSDIGNSQNVVANDVPSDVETSSVVGDSSKQAGLEPHAAEPKTQEEAAVAHMEKMEATMKAHLWISVANDVKSMIPTIKACIKTDCDTARLTEQVLGVASSVMVATQFLVPAGPIIAMVGSVIAAFLAEDKQGPPPLTVDDVRGAVREELYNFNQEKLQWNLKSWAEALAGEALALAGLADGVAPDEEYTRFKDTGLASVVNNVGKIAIKLSAGMESLLDFRNRIKETKHFAEDCHEVCRNDRSTKWPEACSSNLKDVQSRMGTLYNGIELFKYAGARLNTIKFFVDTIFEQQKWEHTFQWKRLDGMLRPVIAKYQKVKKLAESMQECKPDKRGNEYLTQHCDVHDPPMLDWTRRFPGMNWIGFGASHMGSPNTVFSPDLTQETCNYHELMVVSVWSCMGPESTCSDGGPGWKKIGVSQGGECLKEMACCPEQLKTLSWMTPMKGIAEECGYLCHAGGKDVCVRPKVCAEPKCAKTIMNDTAWELKCGIKDCFW